MSETRDGGQHAAAVTEAKYCSNCKRDIAAANFIMHEVHCRRNITLCKECKEPVPKSEMDSHFEEYHKLLTCKCGESIEISKLEEHEQNECMQRQKRCEYCELELPFAELTNHLSFCGSRTDRCPKCQRYIQKRDRDQHDISNCDFLEPKPLTNQTSTRNALYDEDVDETTYHAIVDRFALPNYVNANTLHNGPSTTRALRTVNVSNMIPAEQFYRMVEESDEGEGDSGQGGGERTGLGQNRRQRKNQDRVQNMYKNTNQRRPVATSSNKTDSTKPSNKMAADQLEADHLLALRLAHEDNFLPLEPATSDRDPLLTDFQPQQQEHETRGLENNELDLLVNTGGLTSVSPPRQSREFSRTQSWEPQQYTGFDEAGFHSEVVLPCEFCNQTFPLEDLILHQSGCQILSNGNVFDPGSPPSSLSNNQRPSRLGSVPSQAAVLDNLRGSNVDRSVSPDSVFPPGLSDESSVMLPCEFCGDLLPSEFIAHHQVHCTESKSTSALPSSEAPSSLGGAMHSSTSSLLHNTTAASRTKHSGTLPGSPTKDRLTRRRQEDPPLHNLLSLSGSDDGEREKKYNSSQHSPPVQISSKVKSSSLSSRDIGHYEEASNTKPYGRPSNKTSSQSKSAVMDGVESSLRARKSSRGNATTFRKYSSDKSNENDIDDWIMGPNLLVYNTNKEASLPLKSKGTNNTLPRAKPVTKKYRNSDISSDNITTNPYAFHAHPRSTLNNKKKTDRSDGVSGLLTQLDKDKPRNGGQPGVTGAWKPNVRKTDVEDGEGAIQGGGYIPSFAAEGVAVTRARKSSYSKTSRLAPKFMTPGDPVETLSSERPGRLESSSSSTSSVSRPQPRGSGNKQSSKGRSKHTRKHPSNPP